MEKWSVHELGRFHIEYEPRTAIKGQILVDFIVEFTCNTEAGVEPINSLPVPYRGQVDMKPIITEQP